MRLSAATLDDLPSAAPIALHFSSSPFFFSFIQQNPFLEQLPCREPDGSASWLIVPPSPSAWPMKSVYC